MAAYSVHVRWGGRTMSSCTLDKPLVTAMVQNESFGTRPKASPPVSPELFSDRAAWIVAGGASTALALITAAECKAVWHWPSLLYGLVLWGWWGLVASLFWTMSRRYPVSLHFRPKPLLIHLIGGSILALVHAVLLGSLGFLDPLWRNSQTAWGVWSYYLDLNRLGLEVAIYVAIVGAEFAIAQNLAARRDAFRSAELERQLSVAQLHALQMQLHPHFLFNTLNSITALVEFGRQAEATEMLKHLSGMLKMTLRQKTPEKVPLSQELVLLESYLAIEQARFADRLKIEISIDPAALGGLVPSFLLQPIVENALKHGISQLVADGTIRTEVLRRGSSLLLSVRDNGPGTGAPDSTGHGIGLKNTEDRLQHFYKDRFEMRVNRPRAGGYEVSITIPFEVAHA